MFEPLDDLIRREMERERVPGAAIALIQSGEVSHSAGYGYADLQERAPVTPATRFGAASITKPVLATALMQQCERGRLDLDRPVDDYLAPVRFANPYNEPVTARRLLTHTAGLPVGNLPAAPGAASLREHVEAGARVVHLPGSEIVYANWGYDALGYLLGVLAGRPWHEHVCEALLPALEMASSEIGTVPDARGHFESALDDELRAIAQPPSAVDPPLAAGSLVSTAEDLARFLIPHLCGGRYRDRRVLSRESVADMHAVHAKAGSTQSGMGLGFRVTQRRGRTLICHGGNGQGTTNLVAALPDRGSDRGCGVVLLSNLSSAERFRSVVGNAALALLEGARTAIAPGSAPDPSLEAPIHGRYRSTYWDNEVEVERAGDALRLVVRRAFVAPRREWSSRLEPLGSSRYLARGGMFDGFELEFESRGDATRFYGGVYPFCFERVGAVSQPVEVDAAAELTGSWSGTCDSPLGPLPLFLEIEGPERATATALTADGAALEAFAAERGRVAGQLELDVPNLGRFTLFLRLAVRHGALCGPVHARGESGEFEMPTELHRSDAGAGA